MNRRLILFTGSHCPLCEEAKRLLYPLLPPGSRLREIDIDTDVALRAEYGLRIPVFVVADRDGAVLAEKCWPFTAGQIKRLLAGADSEA